MWAWALSVFDTKRVDWLIQNCSKNVGATGVSLSMVKLVGGGITLALSRPLATCFVSELLPSSTSTSSVGNWRLLEGIDGFEGWDDAIE